jgi:fructosamine-3-kinase
MNAPAQRGAALLGGTLRHSQQLGGGSLSQLAKIELTDGREAVVKTGRPQTEAQMLRAIRAAGAPAPEPYAADDEVLVLEVLPNDGPIPWADLGRVLHELHASCGTRYGWDTDYAFASVAIENSWSDDWPAFWAEHRLLANAPFVGAALARRLERLAADLGNRLPNPPHSLLHGDLWGGNILSAGNKVSGLIDPACYFGHGEVDIAMLQMFDHPGPAFFSAYGELPPGRDERLAIYRLWPSLVHLRLFGTGYRPLVEGLLHQLKV